MSDRQIPISGRLNVSPREGLSQSWLLTLKLFTYLLVVGSAFLAPGALEMLGVPILLYSVLTLYLPLSALRKPARLDSAFSRSVLTLQLILELTVEIGIIYATGAGASPYSGLFYLTIFSAALSFGLVNALALATMATLGHAAVAWLQMAETTGAFPPQAGGTSLWRALREAPDHAFFPEFLYALTFYLTAFVAGYFSERLRSRDQQLADASRELNRARLQTDEIIRRLTTGLLTVNQDGQIILFNESAETILGLSESEVKGRDFRDVFVAGLAELGRELQLALETGDNRPRREIQISASEGEMIPLGVSTAGSQWGGGSGIAVIAVFQDITEVKQMEEKARRSDRLMAVAELSAAIAHEIRNPLSAIAGSAQMLRDELTLGGAEERLFSLILKESSRLNTMLTDFLDYARPDQTLQTRVEVCHLALEAIEMMRHHHSYCDEISLSFEAADTYCYVLGDEGALKQIIFNLLLNAFEALGDRPGERRVEITLCQSGDSAALRISDNGPGIPPESLKKIFSPFFSTKAGGSGLGLAIAHRLAESMNMSLDLSSDARGTVFALQMKTHSDQAPQISRVSADSRCLSGERSESPESSKTI